MRTIQIRKIHALNSKGRAISGTIRPVLPGVWLDADVGEGKVFIFALARRGRALEKAKTLRLEVERDDDRQQPRTMRGDVLYVDSFGVEEVSTGEYWDELPETLRLEIQDRLADDIMAQAQPQTRVSLFQTQHEPYPLQGVAFAVGPLKYTED